MASRPERTPAEPDLDRRRIAAVVGGLAAALTAAWFLVGVGRGYWYDEGVTIVNFVAVSSALDPWREQVFYNNHVLFSFLAHLVHRATGSTAEVTLRLLPVTFAATAVGLLAWGTTRRWGAWAGATAAAVTAAHPLVFDTARDVRGYSLLLLCSVASTLVALHLLQHHIPHRLAAGVYVGLVVAGIATHLFMLGVVAAHVGLVSTHGNVVWRPWHLRWLTATLLGLVTLVGVLPAMAADSGGRIFRPTFPLDVGVALLGSGVALLGLLLLAAGCVAVERRPWVGPAAVLVALVLAAWLVAPRDLYPRFFVWVVPGVAALVGGAAARWRLARVAAVAWTALQIAALTPLAATPFHPLREAADILESASAQGVDACVAEPTAEALLVYTDEFDTVDVATSLDACEVLVAAVIELERPMVGRGHDEFPVARRLEARRAGWAFCRAPDLCQPV